MSESYTIGALARQAGVNGEMVRDYRRRGLVGRTPASARRYPPLQPRSSCAATVRQAPGFGFNWDERAHQRKK